MLPPPVSAAFLGDEVLVCVEDSVDDEARVLLSNELDVVVVVEVVDAALCSGFAVVVNAFELLDSVSLPLSLLLSGHIPVWHGSLEQHPLKSPLEQTYHCLLPVQLIGPAAGGS